MSSSDETSTRAARRARGRPRGWNDKTAQNTIKSLDRAMEVFEYLSENQGRTLSALAAETGQSPATLYRVLVTLEGRGLVEFEPSEQVWHIGARAYVIGARFLRRTTLVERARPILRRLMEQTEETANLGVVQNRSVLFVSQVETHHNIRAFFPPGTLSPLHASGIGKALLAEMPKERLGVLLSEPRESFTQHTLAGKGDLLADLDRIHLRGYAIDDEEKNLGMRCIAAPVFDLNGEPVAGISVSGPTSRVSGDRIDFLSLAVIEAAQLLSRSIGGHSAAAS